MIRRSQSNGIYRRGSPRPTIEVRDSCAKLMSTCTLRTWPRKQPSGPRSGGAPFRIAFTQPSYVLHKLAAVCRALYQGDHPQHAAGTRTVPSPSRSKTSNSWLSPWAVLFSLMAMRMLAMRAAGFAACECKAVLSEGAMGAKWKGPGSCGSRTTGMLLDKSCG